MKIIAALAIIGLMTWAGILLDQYLAHKESDDADA